MAIQTKSGSKTSPREVIERAKAEGWTTPTDEAGTSDRWG